MSESLGAPDLELKAKIVELLNENSTMTVATVRPDGWPQATMVGYAHDDLTLYFVVGRASQKLANIKRDPRVSIAIGRLSIVIGEAHHDRIIGLSMAARVAEVTDIDEIERVNRLAAKQWPERAVFAPREVSAAVMRASPTVISVIDLAMGPGQPELVLVKGEATVHRASANPEGDHPVGSETSPAARPDLAAQPS
jgi:general stress protein 26